MFAEIFYNNLIIDLLLLLTPLIIVKLIEKKKLTKEEFGLHNEHVVDDVLLTGKIFATLILVSIGLAVLFSTVQLDDLHPVEERVRWLINFSPLILVYLFIVRVFLEEFFFRAFLTPRIGALGSSVLFGLAHLGYGSNAEVIGAAVLGFVLAMFYHNNKRLVPNFIAHMLYNLVVIITIGV